MGCLTNLKVKKVSFVTRGANRRQFFLAKSADDESTKEQHLSGGTIVRKEIKAKLTEILKGERNPDKAVALLKGDTQLAVTDAEIAEIQDFLSLMPPPQEDNSDALKKAQDAATALEAENRAMGDRLKKVEQDRHRDEISKWLDAECPFLNIDAKTAVENILAAEPAGEAVVKSLKDSYKSTSDSLKESSLLKEFGHGAHGGEDSAGGGLLTEVRKKINDVQKSDNLKGSAAIIAAFKTMDGSRYEQYRTEFNRRAKQA